MNDFMYGGQKMHVLDMSVERGASHSKTSTSSFKTFAERAKEEAHALKNYERKFITIYSEACLEWYADTPERTLRLSMTGASYVYPQNRKKLTTSNALMVFYNKNGKLIPLWEIRHFESGNRCIFLDKEQMTKKLRSIFKSLNITLGSLTFNGLPCIAWRLQTEEGCFYIPWHNGAVIEDIDGFSFEEKSLKEMKDTYTLLRFAPSYMSGLYKIVCC